MSAVVLPAFDPASLERAARAIQDGELVIVPTDTVYGVAASLARPDAIERMYRAKGRRPDKPIALLVDRFEDVELVAAEIPEAARRLMEAFWPGGLTIVLRAQANVPAAVTAGGPTIAVRMPDHPIPRDLIRRLGEPLPTTSANRSNQPSAVTLAEAVRDLGAAVSVALDAGPAPGGIESSVVDATNLPPIVYRVGAVSIEALETVLGTPVAQPGR